MNIIGKKHIFVSASLTLMFASIILFAVWGLTLGIDFTGGTLLEVEFSRLRISNEEIHKALKPLNLNDVILQPIGEKGVMMRMGPIEEDMHQKILLSLITLAKDQTITEKRFDTIGPTIGKVLRQQSYTTIALTIAGIVLYLSYAFRKISKPVSSWKYGIVAVITLVHDVAIPVGVFVVLGKLHNIEVDSLFITALLTVMGFSVHDTIVIFDRIRENLTKLKGSESFEITVNRSVNETIGRSINTSFTVLIVLLAIFFLGGETTRYFSLALLVGIAFGTYSSIFLASPLLVYWNNWTKQK